MYYRVAAVDALIVYAGEAMSEESADKILALYAAVISSKIAGLIELIPSYTTLYLQFDIRQHTHESLWSIVRALSAHTTAVEETRDRQVIIPTYYDPEVGLDLARISSLHSLDIKTVIDLHSNCTYRVYAIGFAPGFAYMGSVSQQIATPRLSTPRKKIAQGSVAIANTQCAVYPSDSPGGWNILGRTPVKMFDQTAEGFSYLHPGDRVRFVPITREEFVAQGGVL